MYERSVLLGSKILEVFWSFCGVVNEESKTIGTDEGGAKSDDNRLLSIVSQLISPSSSSTS